MAPRRWILQHSQRHTDGIFPIITMSGDPDISPGPYPALSVKLDLAPGEKRSLTWAHAADESVKASWELVITNRRTTLGMRRLRQSKFKMKNSEQLKQVIPIGTLHSHLLKKQPSGCWWDQQKT